MPERVDSAETVRHFILGTAGHIDHGKTSLVRALTGTDTDRLPEERRRGMTIELGFAELTIGAVRFGVVDVPGHERFIRTMVAGASGVDVGLLVVAADDSVMPQTIEHVEILRLLGVRRVVAAITKTDTVDPEMVALVRDDTATLLIDALGRECPICPVSSITGAGLDALRDALAGACEGIERTTDARPFRMTVDRVFTVAGRGTVVTGSAMRGAVSVGDTLGIHPGGATCRVRDMQTHGAGSAALGRGQRCALNLSGADRRSIERGAELATPGYLTPARMLDVRLDALKSYARPLKSTSLVRFEIGTREIPARVVLLGLDALPPGESAFAQIRAGESITATHGQRFIIRDENATRTIGGGRVLRPLGQRRRHGLEDERAALQALDAGDVDDRVEQVLRRARFEAPTALQLCARAGVEVEDAPAVLERLESRGRWAVIPGTSTYVVPGAIDDLQQRLAGWLTRHHAAHPDTAGRSVDSVVGWLERMSHRAAARPILDELLRRGDVKSIGGFIGLPSFAPALAASDERALAAIIDEFRVAGLQPPAVAALRAAAQLDRKRLDRLVTLAIATGSLVRLDAQMILHAEAERALRESVTQLMKRNDGGGVTVAQVREALGSSRKYVVPFLEYLDRVGHTRRVGDKRVPAQPAAD